MTVRALDSGEIRLEGRCPSADAETLLSRLAGDPDAVVDWRACEYAHAAVVQVLLAARPPMVGPAGGAFLETFVAPLIARRRGT